MLDQQLAQYTTGLSVLYVEDDPVGANIIRLMLGKYFVRVHGARNGLEGLELFHELKPDLVLTDLMMPVLDGLGMIRQLRAIDQRLPVILMTASLEHVHLVDAINLGVSKFLAKPITFDALQPALLAVVRELYLERTAERMRQQEVELLRYRNRYNVSQQELAQAKERHITGDAPELRYVSADARSGWRVDYFQQPRDIMSGDSHSIRENGAGKILVFLADAMGHGLSASVTSMLATAFFNHVSKGSSCSHLGFAHIANSTLHFASDNILEDEAFCGIIMEVDAAHSVVSLVSCGMPALHVVRDGQVELIRGVNPPVSSYFTPLKIQEISLRGVSEIILATDGLGDAVMSSGGCFREILAEAISATTTAAELFSYYTHHCDDAQNDDDITLIRLINSSDGEGDLPLRA